MREEEIFPPDFVDSLIGRKPLSPAEERQKFYKDQLNGRELGQVISDWVLLDNSTIITREMDGSHSDRIGNDAYGSSVPVARENQVGRFNSNSGVMVRVDGEGRSWVAPFTAERQQELIDAGYQGEGGGIAVPHLYDFVARFKDEGTHKRWIEMSEKAGLKAHDFQVEHRET